MLVVLIRLFICDRFIDKYDIAERNAFGEAMHNSLMSH